MSTDVALIIIAMGAAIVSVGLAMMCWVKDCGNDERDIE